jgi:hypothetical protein
MTMKHCIDEMGRLADFLPGLYKQENAEQRRQAIM